MRNFGISAAGTQSKQCSSLKLDARAPKRKPRSEQAKARASYKQRLDHKVSVSLSREGADERVQSKVYVVCNCYAKAWLVEAPAPPTIRGCVLVQCSHQRDSEERAS